MSPETAPYPGGPLKLPPALGVRVPIHLRKGCVLGSTQVLVTNVISIGSSVSVGFTAVTDRHTHTTPHR